MNSFKVFICPVVFKKYDASENGQRIRSKRPQQGIRDILNGLPDDSSGFSI